MEPRAGVSDRVTGARAQGTRLRSTNWGLVSCHVTPELDLPPAGLYGFTGCIQIHLLPHPCAWGFQKPLCVPGPLVGAGVDG